MARQAWPLNFEREDKKMLDKTKEEILSSERYRYLEDRSQKWVWLLQDGIERLKSCEAMSFREWSDLLSAADCFFNAYSGAGRLVVAVLDRGVEELLANHNQWQEDDSDARAFEGNIPRYIGDPLSANFRYFYEKEIDQIVLKLISYTKGLDCPEIHRRSVIENAVFAWLSCQRPSHVAVRLLAEKI